MRGENKRENVCVVVREMVYEKSGRYINVMRVLRRYSNALREVVIMPSKRERGDSGETKR